MVYLSKRNLDRLVAHAKREYPNEACGILAGKESHVEKMYEMVNTANSRIKYFMDPKEQLGVMKDIRNSGLDMIGIYHSHPDTEAYPSEEDRKMAFYPEAHYLIISLKDKANPITRAFKIGDTDINEKDIGVKE